MNLLCQGAGGLWTGLGGATPGGGQALIRSHGPPRKRVGGVDRSLSGQWSLTTSAGLLGQTPAHDFLDHVGQVFVGLAGDVTFQTPHDLCGVQPFFSPSSHITAGVLVRGHAGKDDPVEGGVGLTVTSPVQPEPGGHLA